MWWQLIVICPDIWLATRIKRNSYSCWVRHMLCWTVSCELPSLNLVKATYTFNPSSLHWVYVSQLHILLVRFLINTIMSFALMAIVCWGLLKLTQGKLWDTLQEIKLQRARLLLSSLDIHGLNVSQITWVFFELCLGGCVAQLVERRTCNQRITGSHSSGGNHLHMWSRQ